MVRRLAPRVYEGGGTSAHTGAGGSSSPAYLSKNSVKDRVVNTEKLFYLTLCCRKFVLPRHHLSGLVPPPSQVRGARAAAPPALQIPICRATVQNRCVNSESAAQRLLTSSLFTIHLIVLPLVPEGDGASGRPPPTELLHYSLFTIH